MTANEDPARDTRGRLAAQDDCCGSEPPEFLYDDKGWKWKTGDCWCTLPVDHDGKCVCEICRDRFGAPGWEKP